MAGRHKKILAQLKRMDEDKEKAALAKMDSNQRWDYYCKQNAAKLDPREIQPINNDGLNFITIPAHAARISNSRLAGAIRPKPIFLMNSAKSMASTVSNIRRA